MKKNELLTVMALLTVLGIGITAMGFLSLFHEDPSASFSQVWNQLWELHAGFGWTMAIYCSLMLAFDLWVMAGILSQTPEKNLAD